MRSSVSLVFLFLALVASSQTAVNSIKFNLLYNGNEIRPGSLPKNSGADSLSIETLRFYISEIQLLNEKKVVWSERNSYHLLDAFEKRSLTWQLKGVSKTTFNKVIFKLGIDSATNMAGAMGGDLDPTKGMYWTWQSGYINFKLEGTSTKCKTRKGVFQFHLGGYSNPFNACTTVELAHENNTPLEITFDVGQFLKGIDLATQNEIMTPSKEAVLLSEKAGACFRIKK